MKFSVTKQPKSTLKIEVEISPEEMQPHLDRAAETLSKEYKIEGFRPGKASLGIVTQKLGATAVWQHAAEFAVRKSYVEVVNGEKLKVVGSPEISVTKLAPDNPFTYTAAVAVMPDVTVGDYQSFKTKKAAPQVTDEQVGKTLGDLQSMFAKETPVDRPAQSGDKVEVDFDIFLDHVLLENGSSKQHPVVIGSGNFLPEFEQNLVGMKKDETKEFPVNFPKDYHHDKVAGKKGDFKVTVKSIAQIDKPELNDDFAKQAGTFSSLEELRKKIRENLTNEADSVEDRKFENGLVDELIQRSKFGELPDVLVEGELDKMLHELEEEVMHQGGLSFDDYLRGLKKTRDQLKAEFRPQAERRVKAALVLRQISDMEKIEPKADEVEAEVQRTLAMYKDDPEIRSRIDSPNYRDYLGHLQVNRRTIALLKEKATASK